MSTLVRMQHENIGRTVLAGQWDLSVIAGSRLMKMSTNTKHGGVIIASYRKIWSRVRVCVFGSKLGVGIEMQPNKIISLKPGRKSRLPCFSVECLMLVIR